MGDRIYPLRISILGWDTSWEVPDRSKIQPDHGFGASYRIDMNRIGRKKPDFVRQAGPSYYWLPDSTLVEQGFSTPNLVEVRTYDAEGTLDLYQHYDRVHAGWFSCAKTEPAALEEEWFDQDGTLIGFRAMGRCYWDGKEITKDEYSRLFLELRAKRPRWHPKPSA